jgi:hypothetical protein
MNFKSLSINQININLKKKIQILLKKKLKNEPLQFEISIKTPDNQ